METITASAPPDITLSSPGELLSAVPYLLGYIPRDCLVIVGMAAHRITATGAFPLPEPGRPFHLADKALVALAHNAIDTAVVVGYGEPIAVTRGVDRLTELLRERRIALLEAMRVTDGRYWSYTCDEDCCPVEGTAVPGPGSAVDAALTVCGMQALPDRDAVLAQLEPVTGETGTAVARATRRVAALLDDTDSLIAPHSVLREAATGILDRAASTGELPDVDDSVRLAAALRQPRFRAEAVVGVDRNGATRMSRLWLWVTRHNLPPFRAEAAAVLGYAAWRSGNGVLAAEALRRCLEEDPDCRLASIILSLVDSGQPPSSLPALPDPDLVQ